MSGGGGWGGREWGRGDGVGDGGGGGVGKFLVCLELNAYYHIHIVMKNFFKS